LTAEYKYMGNYREIANVKNVEYCSGIRNPNSALKKIRDMIAHTSQGFIHDCPYLVVPLRITNYTDPFMTEVDQMDKGDGKLTAAFHLGAIKGDMRLRIKMTTDEDENFFDFMLAYTVKLRRASSL